MYIHFDLDKHFIEKLLHGWGAACEDDGSSWGANTTSVISDRAREARLQINQHQKRNEFTPNGSSARGY